MKPVYLTAAAALALSASPAQAEWVASWTASPHAPIGTTGPFAAASYENVTVSQILRITEGGGKVRVRFSNRYGPARSRAARRGSSSSTSRTAKSPAPPARSRSAASPAR